MAKFLDLDAETDGKHDVDEVLDEVLTKEDEAFIDNDELPESPRSPLVNTWMGDDKAWGLRPQPPDKSALPGLSDEVKEVDLICHNPSSPQLEQTVKVNEVINQDTEATVEDTGEMNEEPEAPKGPMLCTFGVMTFNNYQDFKLINRRGHKKTVTPKRLWAVLCRLLSFFGGTPEVGKKGTKHYQVFWMAKHRSVDLAQIHKALTNKGITIKVGKNAGKNATWLQRAYKPKLAFDYAMHLGAHVDKPRDGDTFEFGTRPTEAAMLMSKGQRTDLTDMATAIADGATIKDIAYAHPAEFFRYNRGIERMMKIFAPKPTKSPFPFKTPWGQTVNDPTPGEGEIPAKRRHLWLWGEVNVRKSGWFNEQFADTKVFMVGNDPVTAWEGYDGELLCIWDMVTPPTYRHIEEASDWSTVEKPMPGRTRFKKEYYKPRVARMLLVIQNAPPQYFNRTQHFNERFLVHHIKEKIKVTPLKQKLSGFEMIIGDPAIEDRNEFQAYQPKCINKDS